MSNKINFTKAALDSLELPPPGQRITYHDHGGKDSVNGLQLRVTANGTRTFYVFKRVHGRPERTRVGKLPYPATTIEEARRGALGILNQIARGESPRVTERESKTKGMTVSEAFARYIERKDGTAGAITLHSESHVANSA